MGGKGEAMARGKPGQVVIRLKDGREVVGETVHAHCAMPIEDVAALREYGRASGEGYAGLLERLLREALAPIVQAAHDARRERDELRAERIARSEEVKRLLEELKEEQKRLAREIGRAGE